MSSANEQDVVIAFRQAVEEEMRKAQEEGTEHVDQLNATGLSSEELMRRLRERHLELEREVALLRTIVLRLISEPVDEQ